MFKELFLESKYTKVDKGKLQKLQKDLNKSISSLRKKLTAVNLGSAGDKKEISDEIKKLQLKLDQVNLALNKGS